MRSFILMFLLIPIITSCKTAALPPEIQAASYVLRGIVITPEGRGAIFIINKVLILFKVLVFVLPHLTL